MPLDRMQVVLKRSAAQESALKQLITDLHTPGSASYHKWLTPDQFGKQFGPSDQDIATVEILARSPRASASPGSTPAGRPSKSPATSLSCATAFHAQIHKYMVNGETHYANATDPQIPAALAPVFGGFASPQQFPRRRTMPKSSAKPPTTPGPTRPRRSGPTGPGTPASTITLFSRPATSPSSTISTPLYACRTRRHRPDHRHHQRFQHQIYLGQSVPHALRPSRQSAAGHHRRQRPRRRRHQQSRRPNGDSVEAYLDVEWAGAVAPNATIDLVIAADTALEYGLFSPPSTPSTATSRLSSA